MENFEIVSSGNVTNDVLNFNFQGHEIRGLAIDGEPWFVGKDVAEALGYKNPRGTITKKIDKEDRGVSNLETPSGKQDTTIINESGLYSLILGSQLESAKEFKRWVTKDVLPAIRKTGSYIYGQENMTDDEKLAYALVLANTRLVAYEKRINKLKEKSIEQSSFIELMSGSKDRYMTTEIATYYGMSAITFNKMLANMKIQSKIDGVWVLAHVYRGQGYMVSSYKNIYEDGVVVEKRPFNAWTKEGVRFLYYMLKEDGILPLMEIENRNTLEKV